MNSQDIFDARQRLYEAMEDFDNVELDAYEHDEQLMDAVVSFNEREGTVYDKYKELIRYKSWQRERNQPDY